MDPGRSFWGPLLVVVAVCVCAVSGDPLGKCGQKGKRILCAADESVDFCLCYKLDVSIQTVSCLIVSSF